MIKCPRCEKDFPIEDIWMFSFDPIFTYLDPYCCEDCLYDYLWNFREATQWIKRFREFGGEYQDFTAWNQELLIKQMTKFCFSDYDCWSTWLEPEATCPECGFIFISCIHEEAECPDDNDDMICRNCGYIEK